MKMNLTRFKAAMFPLLIATILGCGQAPDYRDQRLAEFAQRSNSEQVQQNARMAEIVQRDAESRKALMATHLELTSQLNRQQAFVDAGRDRLEQDRRDIAQQRHRDPIIAAVLQSTGMLLVCLVPLFLAAYALKQMRQEETDHAAVAELLVCEITSDKPLFLPSPALPRLTASRNTKLHVVTKDTSGDSEDFPF